jgi:AcrR family transcriptional regulator
VAPRDHPDHESEESSTRTRRRTGRPRDHDLDDRIRAAADELMAEGGYDAVTISGVARRSGLPRSTVYRRHPTQFSLRYSCLMLPAGGPDPVLDSGDIDADMRRHIRANAVPFADPAGRALLRSIITDILSDAEGRRLVNQEEVEPRLAEIAEVIDRARARGDLPQRCDPQLAATAITGTLINHALILDRPVDDAFLELLRLLLFGA